MNSDVTKYDAMEISIQTSLLEKERFHEEEEEEEENDSDHMNENDEFGEETQDDTILAQVDPNLDTIFEENSVRKSRDTSPVGSTMSLRSRGSQMSKGSRMSAGSRRSVGSRMSVGSRISESQNSELWGDNEKTQASLLREEIKQYDVAYRGHIRNQKQYNNAQQLLQELINKAQNSQQNEPRSSRRGRNPSNTQSTSSSSTSRSKTRKSEKKPEKTTRKESPNIGMTSGQVSELDDKEFRAYWKEKGFNETIKKLTAGNMTPGSATRKVFEKKMFAYLEK